MSHSVHLQNRPSIFNTETNNPAEWGVTTLTNRQTSISTRRRNEHGFWPRRCRTAILFAASSNFSCGHQMSSWLSNLSPLKIIVNFDTNFNGIGCKYADYFKRILHVCAERSKARVCGRSLAGIAGSTPAEGMGVCLMWVLYAEISATGQSLVQRVPTEGWILPSVTSPFKNKCAINYHNSSSLTKLFSGFRKCNLYDF
jgi:hypothetical protein